jgi:hypothetical protein
MNVSIAHLEPAGLLTRRQLWRRYINSFRDGTLTRPFGVIEERCARTADKLDRIREIRDAIDAVARRQAEPPINDIEDWFGRDEFRRKADIARSIYHGGE